MPVIIPKKLPATKILQDENIFIMNDIRALSQDIRPLKIIILNLMPDKITTETQLLRQLSNFPIQVEITLLAIENHTHKNTSITHLNEFYKNFSDIKNNKYDAMIITGAPIEHLNFEDVKYWPELKSIFDWTKTNVFTTLFICWASQAALYHFYNIDKISFEKKLFGVYEHYILKNDKLFSGINKIFKTPHSRNTESNQKDIYNNDDLDVLAKSNEAGIHIITNKNRSQLFFTGHFEYDKDTLEKEYLRDKDILQDKVTIPENYYIDNNPNNKIKDDWFSDASLIFINWLNYYVYQDTPFNFVNRK